jgi:hypothetical protein
MPVHGTTSAACATTTPARTRHKGYPGAVAEPFTRDAKTPQACQALAEHPPWPDRQRTRAEDRIRAARATGLRNLPLHRTTQNRIWLEIVQIALDLPAAWMPMLALTSKTGLREPRRLRLRPFTTAGQLVTTGHRRILHLARHRPWSNHITAALDRLNQLPDPG